MGDVKTTLAASKREETFEEVAERMAARARDRGDVETLECTPRPAEVIQFPLWPEPDRAAPNAFLRSALFGVVKKGARTWLKDEPLASWPGASIRYKGEQLDQYDESVWLQLVHLHRAQGVVPGTPLRIFVRAFIRALGSSYGRNSRKSLYESLKRLRANAVTLEGHRKHIGGLLMEAAEDATGEHWTVIIDPKIATLFVPGDYSRLDWKTRLALKADLAKWLHGYVVSHQATLRHPHRLAVERLRNLSGSTTTLKDFRWKLKRAMTELERVGVVDAWSITAGDALEFVRPRQRLPKELPEST